MDILAYAVFTAAVDRLVRVGKKKGLTDADVGPVFEAVLAKHYPQASLPLKEK